MPIQMKTASETERRYDLDWIRVAAVFLLVPFHSALIFSHQPDDVVYIKDLVESNVLKQLAYFVDLWHMPLLFFISGAGTWFALAFRSGRQYLEERFLRLFIPLLFAVTILIPPMVYLQHAGTGEFASFWAFYPQFFHINVSDLSGLSGNFTPAHMWFVLFLFVYAAVTLPLFLYLRHGGGQNATAWLAARCEGSGVIFLLALLPAMTALLPDIGGKAPFLYLTYFILGYALMGDARFQQAMDRHKWVALGIGIIAALTVSPLARAGVSMVIIHIFYYLGRWSWIVALCGLGHAYFNRDHAFLRYANTISYPFYILHFLVNTLVGYFVVRWQVGVALKYLLINLATFAGLFVVIEVVRRIPVTRFLLGMKSPGGASRQPFEAKPALGGVEQR
ncbi:MAG: acyltransferase family protein [Anaerolineae bacterium]|nr:acyltransferase family protein [Anaerolineae bacterium]